MDQRRRRRKRRKKGAHISLPVSGVWNNIPPQRSGRRSGLIAMPSPPPQTTCFPATVFSAPGATRSPANSKHAAASHGAYLSQRTHACTPTSRCTSCEPVIDPPPPAQLISVCTPPPTNMRALPFAGLSVEMPLFQLLSLHWPRPPRVGAVLLNGELEAN